VRRIERYLTEADRANLESYRYKCKQVRDMTAAVLRGTHTGLMLFGAGGNGKSYSIRETLEERRVKEILPEDTLAAGAEDEDEPKEEFGYDSWVNHQGRITPKGLVEQMARFPQSVHLVEDAETMFDDRNSWGVLRMALHSQDHSLHPKRRITWKISTKGGSFDFYFTGSLVIVANRLLKSDSEEVEAVKTRCPVVNFDISNEGLVAKMKELCNNGYNAISTAPLTAHQCYDVLDFILTAIEKDPLLKRDARGAEKKLNMRLLISGFRFLALGKMEPAINWKHMLLDQLKQVVGAAKRTRAERIHDETEIAREIAAKKWPSQHDKLVEWCRRTGRSPGWADEPRDSDAYKRGLNCAKTDFTRKNK
jgi:hypothetical protein